MNKRKTVFQGKKMLKAFSLLIAVSFMQGGQMPLFATEVTAVNSPTLQVGDITVKGQVLDETGLSVPGANVVVKGQPTIGTVTDLDGNFTLSVPKGSTLVVSFIGYKNFEVAAEAGKSIVVKLEPDAEALDEVIVVGYTTVKKSSVTGAIGSVKADKLKDVTTPSVAGMLQGKVAGVVVTPTSGQPGAGVTIRVRGLGSLRGNQDPLWVIDGVVGASSSELNPNDIENISILKDGSATALYGSRGANGVIQVTTKRAKAGTSQFDASVKFGFSELQRGKLRMMNGAEYYDYLVEAFTNAGTLEEQHWLQPYLRDQNFDWWDEATQWPRRRTTTWATSLVTKKSARTSLLTIIPKTVPSKDSTTTASRCVQTRTTS